jgi:hypothetical protein
MNHQVVNRVLSATLSLACGVAASGCGGAQHGRDEHHNAAQDDHGAVSLGLAEALPIAAAEYPTGIAVEAEWDTEKKLADHPMLEVEFLVDGKMEEVFVCPHRGVVVKKLTEEIKAEDQATYAALPAAMQAANANLAVAIEKAFGTYPKEQVMEVEFALVDGRLVVEVETAAKPGAEGTKHKHDAQTWALIP